MSPNIDHHLNSYQHCSEHEALNVEESDDSAIAIDVGVSIGTKKSCSSLEVVNRKRKRHAVLLFLFATILAVGVIGWFASDVFSSSRRNHDNQGIDSGSTVEQPDTNHDDASEYTSGHEDDSSHNIPNLIWSDEFDGDSIDLTKWTFVNGDGCDVGLCGWGNNELEWYTPSNAHVSHGKLIMEARKFETPGGPPSYTSAKIISRGKADFGVLETSIDEVLSKSGKSLERSRRFESRLKLPWGKGIWPAFWMLPTDDTFGGWPKSGEIDIMENIGKEGPNTVHGTVHYGLDWPQHQYSESGITALKSSSTSPYTNSIGNLNETFHTFAVERLPGVIRWYIDDIEYSSITKEEMMPYHWPFDEDFYFILNLAVGGNWPGYPDDDDSDGETPVFPQRLEVDYVRVYEDTFPRVVGKSVVDCSEKAVEYEIANIEAEDISFTWVVPQNATIKEGQGTSRVVVNFDSSMRYGNMIDTEFVQVQANGIDGNSASNSIGLAKLQVGIGIRVKIVDFNGKCSATNKVNSGLKKFSFDCGRPSSCTTFVLHKTTDEYTCGERIEWLINGMGMDEKEACTEVGYKQFHGHCGPCNPLG